jgi:hypothetical protein
MKKKIKTTKHKPNLTILEMVSRLLEIAKAQQAGQLSLASHVAPICTKFPKVVVPEEMGSDSSLASELAKLVQLSQSNLTNLVELDQTINL